jgi:hypothetical protein
MAMGLVRNYPALERLIKNYTFPVGRWLGTNTRCWTVNEVEAWLANRPTERPVPTTARQEAEFHDEDYPEEQPPTGEP